MTTCGDFAILDGGRNGWTGPDEKAQARRCLADHVRTGRLIPDRAAAYALTSSSASDRGAKRLRELLSLRDSISWTLADQHFGDRGPIYTENIYERATDTSLDDLDDDPGQVAAALTDSAASKPRQ